MLVMVVGGCGQKSYNKQRFVLDISRPASLAKEPGHLRLKVEPFTINPAFASKSLVYRKSRFQFETDFYNEFLISPTDLVTQVTRQWMSQSDLFEYVNGNAGKNAVVLQANIFALYGDFSHKSQPGAVAAIQFFLTRNNEVLFHKTYTEKTLLDTLSADGLMKALNECLENILKDLEFDMRAKLDKIAENSEK
ncbi:MAG: hypothetical protein A2Y07_08685 [Planctomycetes bacterium GWF2_50_10]|nr:MAG: hypothetical protein A2Y07_08685 [Planctomycetes bacterium GWF2_50_10]